MNVVWMTVLFSFLPLCRLDRQTQATTLVHQIFGGYLRSRGIDFAHPQKYRKIAPGAVHFDEFPHLAAFGY